MGTDKYREDSSNNSSCRTLSQMSNTIPADRTIWVNINIIAKNSAKRNGPVWLKRRNEERRKGQGRAAIILIQKMKYQEEMVCPTGSI